MKAVTCQGRQVGVEELLDPIVEPPSRAALNSSVATPAESGRLQGNGKGL